MTKRWTLPPDRTSAARSLATSLGVAEPTALLLANRGLTEPEDARRFLQPSLHELEDPCRHEAVTAAAAFLHEAVLARRRIAVFGDFDADGICAAALLMRCLRQAGADVELYIPHRIDEGYGLSCEALEQLAAGGVQVVVTVDCGVTALEPAACARALGLDLVVTDHHEPGEELPAAAHILNPKLPGQEFGYRYLAGVGVAFKLVWALGQQMSVGHRVSDEFRELMMESLSLVALGTVADVVPLLEENRVLAHFGLRALAAPSTPGLRALVAAGRLRGERVTAEDVGFRLAPRLNAAGRMGDARAAVEMLMTDDEQHAAEMVAHLEAQNRLRIATQRAAVRQAHDMLEADPALSEASCIVLASPEWHQGIVGLVASRLAEHYWRPAFVFAVDGEVACGSARGVPGCSMFAIVSRCADLLTRYGGHAGAAGMTLPTRNLPAFTERVNEAARAHMGAAPPPPELPVDGWIALQTLTPALVHEMGLLGPFGAGNPQPLFAASGLRLVGNGRTVGSNGNHLAFMVRQDRTTLRAIAMGRAEWLPELRARKGEPFSLAFQPGLDYYQRTAAVELRVQDFQWDDDPQVERRAE
ncbi:MAG: single-stranded-DNA-specific exonuclease RecJ [Candidatus Brocadiaceae bacterium]|nr:single-stranded-DNA-specific exonuclease RecJ [Candidatus Brocadiaceae bacterium]